jgi:periplasmic divalent cation tolerance protein
MSINMLTVHIGCANKKEAEKIAQILLDKKLIACANFFPIDSFYLWKKNLEKTSEYSMMCKTRKELFSKIVKEVEAVHSYDVPVITAVEEKTTAAVEKWIKEEL